MPNVQQETPDDGQRRCPEHIEFYNRINLDNQGVWLIILKRKRLDVAQFPVFQQYKTRTLLYSKSSVAVACFLPGRAKDLSAPV